MPLKQNGILKHIKKNKVCIIGVLETKLTQQSLEGMVGKKFKFWKSKNNLELNPHGRILILCKEDKATLEIMEKSDQVIHCLVTCKSSSIKFHLSFVYAFNTIVGRRPLWDNLRRFGSDCVVPWMILGDFNNVLSNDEKVNGLPVTSYATRDFRNCCYDTDISDMSSSGVFYTWKLKAVKDPLKDLNRKEFSHISSRVEAVEEELIRAQQHLYDNLEDQNLQIGISELRTKTLKLAEAELSFCSQLAKAKYLKNSDKCTKFFHDIIKSNRSKNHIASTLLEDGSRTNSSNNIGEDKAPGPDGYSSCFYKTAWDVIGRDFIEAVKEFFSSGQILKQLNHTVLALIPKSKEADRVEDFRPIACCNVTYKVISKIIASRLAPALNSIVDSAQSAFVQNRCTTNNIFLLQELLRKYGRKRISPCCILNVDLRKSFDLVDLDFLHDMLSALQFPPRFIDWILECITTASYSLTLNGSLHGFFKGKRDLQQCDPLSLYLFVLCLEYLSKHLGQLKENPDFNFHPRCGGLKLTHLAFADDLVLFSRGDPKSVSLLMESLKHFGDCSGLKISLSKSNLFAASISSMDLDSIKDITGFPQGTFPFRYLGIPIADSSLTIAQFSPLLDKIQGYISAWARANLSYAGRIELVKSVLQGIEYFWLSIFPIPAGIWAKIVKHCKSFLWSGNYNSKKKPLVAWKEITLPKVEGGLGIRNIEAWNKALLSKTLRNIQAKKDSIWVQWVHHIYMNKRNFWDYKSKHEDSPLIKQISNLRDEIIVAENTVEGAIQKMNKWTSNGELKSRIAYDFAQQVWNSIKGWLGFRRTLTTLKAAVKWTIKKARGTRIQAKAKRLGLACTTYYLWEARNLRIFKGKVQAPEAVIRNIQEQLVELKSFALRLADAERSFCSQLAKMKFLKENDKGSKLAHVITKLVAPAQAAFVQGHAMVDNVYLVQKLLKRYGWDRIFPRWILKIDLRKAFDSINWDFMKDILLGLDFLSLFVDWIMQCVSTVTYSISINGSLHGFFKVKQVQFIRSYCCCIADATDAILLMLMLMLLCFVAESSSISQGLATAAGLLCACCCDFVVESNLVLKIVCFRASKQTNLNLSVMLDGFCSSCAPYCCCWTIFLDSLYAFLD
ncbi:hypothetical protein Acr_04g0001490 [Actinidia rufa]|uniref:Reverse transcriptase domain-containing protein n=1 Tax=Actinidia rufa TaxID=165716 RepID=A0A7J0EG31_9ERIC|nr:hypothetical protein Acr_04g0001490 [Actinidia rufa]